ncbi:kelch-like protein 23 [Sparus aurata]|uniref:kelch-like protein 23 n=1 Tax=Sparus aurata TaxID=8175 RepID=UPI0011C0DA16|nr:kelch-like protein 23 [Sparus aurata]
MLDALRDSEGLFPDTSLQCSTSQVPQGGTMCSQPIRQGHIHQLLALEMEVLSALADYIYSSRFTIPHPNVESLLKAADLVQFGGVKRALQGLPHVPAGCVDHCLGMLPFSQLHTWFTLEEDARRLLAGRFQEVIKKEECLELELDSLRTVLAEENQEVVAEAVGRWLDPDPLL